MISTLKKTVRDFLVNWYDCSIFGQVVFIFAKITASRNDNKLQIHNYLKIKIFLFLET